MQNVTGAKEFATVHIILLLEMATNFLAVNLLPLYALVLHKQVK
jgi:hypothetical protein